MFISHGVAQHCGRHESIAKHLNENGYLVAAHDHGMNGGGARGGGGGDRGCMISLVMCYIHCVTFLQPGSNCPNIIMCVCLCVMTVGHGQSEGDRVHIDSIELYARDVIQHVERLKGEHPDLPVFLLGHSMVRCKLHAQNL